MLFLLRYSFLSALRRTSTAATPLGSGRASPMPPASPYTAATSPAPPAPPSSSSSSAALAAAAGASTVGGLAGASFGSQFYSGGFTPAPQSAASSDLGDWEGYEQQQQQPYHQQGSAGGGVSGGGLEGQAPLTSLDPWGPLQAPAGLQLPPINTSAQPAAAAAAAAGSSGGSNGDGGGATAAMRLGLKLEQRGDVRRLVDVLARRVRQAGDDLAAAVAEVRMILLRRGGCNCMCMQAGACRPGLPQLELVHYGSG